MFDSCKNNTKQLWKEINKSIHLSHNKHQQYSNIAPTIQEISSNGQNYSDPMDIAEKLNEYFSTMGKKLAEQLIVPTACMDYTVHLPPQLCSSFAFIEFTYTEVNNMIVKLKNRKSVGVDNLSAKFVYEFSDVLTVPLCNIFNHSVESGVFPNALKLAKTIPIPKTKDNLNLPNNYRPISLLSFFSKVFESLISKRITAFFSKNNILYDYQF